MYIHVSLQDELGLRCSLTLKQKWFIDLSKKNISWIDYVLFFWYCFWKIELFNVFIVYRNKYMYSLGRFLHRWSISAFSPLSYHSQSKKKTEIIINTPIQLMLFIIVRFAASTTTYNEHVLFKTLFTNFSRVLLALFCATKRKPHKQNTNKSDHWKHLFHLRFIHKIKWSSNTVLRYVWSLSSGIPDYVVCY